MALGAGKYDKECAEVMQSTQADALLLVVLDGNRGPGMSCKARSDPRKILALCDALEVALVHIRRETLRDLAALADPPPAYTCPHCRAQSWNPGDRTHGYCGRCHRYATDAAAA